MQKKIVIVGATQVGKTHLWSKLYDTDLPLEEKGQPSYTADFKKFHRRSGSYQYNLWVLPGNERYLNAISNNYKDADVIILCFDRKQKNSLVYLQTIIKSIKKINSNCRYLLVETKIDEDNQITEIIDEEINQFIDDYPIENYIKTSAKNNKGITELSNRMANIAKASDNNLFLVANEDANNNYFILKVVFGLTDAGLLILAIAALTVSITIASVPAIILSAAAISGGVSLGVCGYYFFKHLEKNAVIDKSLHYKNE